MMTREQIEEAAAFVRSLPHANGKTTLLAILASLPPDSPSAGGGECPRCNGTGEIAVSSDQGHYGYKESCPVCGGRKDLDAEYAALDQQMVLLEIGNLLGAKEGEHIIDTVHRYLKESALQSPRPASGWVSVQITELQKLRLTHTDCDDCWYSCSTLTCDDKRKSDVCDCGADKWNKRIDNLLASPQPDAKQEEK